MNRVFDIFVALFILFLAMPLLVVVCFLVWFEDKHSPFYIAPRVGKDGKLFNMLKLRSMVINADSSGVDSTGASDKRITGVGRFIRRYKLDELSQLWNVLKGDMSLVGPRPNVQREVDLYTVEEMQLLSVRPGITDLASIVFSDEGEILDGAEDPDLLYNQIIRPWKSRLGLFCISSSSFKMNLTQLFLTAMALLSRSSALQEVVKLLKNKNADPALVEVAGRSAALSPAPPPGVDKIVVSRSVAAIRTEGS
jgi:lipopolysaccharide/colanic/teichoic acid biosynthesis glycosyltransferase